MKVAQGSSRYILPFFIPILISGFFPWGSLVATVSISFGFYLIWFFRDPERSIKIDENVIYAAADGIVLYTEEKEGSYKVAIRMSPFDVHLNRSPVSGTILSTMRKPGSHRSVYFSGAEEKNESNLIRIQSTDMELEVLQLTGAFARRIEVWVEENEEVSQGQKIGMIRFGSQTNVLVKTDKLITITVDVGDKVKAGLTKIMEVKNYAQ